MKVLDLRQHFEKKIDKTETCWEWLGGKYPRGYGHVALLGENLAHRVSYRIYVGDIPDGLYVLHRCDNPSCVNPDHLFVGDQSDNMKDMEMKGRTNRAVGASHGSRTHPERLARGNENGMNTRPERRPTGDRNGRSTRPERTARGEKVGLAKLKTVYVLEIRQLYADGRYTQSQLGKMYGVGQTQISAIIQRRQWKHV